MLEYKRISELTAAGAQDGTEILEVEQAGISKKISGDVPAIDGLSAITSLNLTDLLRLSQGVGAHKKMTISDFLTSAGITSFSQAVDVSASDFAQVSTAKKQLYLLTTAAGSKDFDMLALASQEGCRVRIVKADTGAGVATVDPNGAETFLGGETAFPLRKQGDFIEYEVTGGVAVVIDSLATIDSNAIAVNQRQTLGHGCGVAPRTINTYWRNAITEFGFAVGEEITSMNNFYNPAAAATNLWQVCKDATNIIQDIYNAGNTPLIARKDTGAWVNLTMANWIFRHRYSL